MILEAELATISAENAVPATPLTSALVLANDRTSISVRSPISKYKSPFLAVQDVEVALAIPLPLPNKPIFEEQSLARTPPLPLKPILEKLPVVAVGRTNVLPPAARPQLPRPEIAAAILVVPSMSPSIRLALAQHSIEMPSPPPHFSKSPVLPASPDVKAAMAIPLQPMPITIVEDPSEDVSTVTEDERFSEFSEMTEYDSFSDNTAYFGDSEVSNSEYCSLPQTADFSCLPEVTDDLSFSESIESNTFSSCESMNFVSFDEETDASRLPENTLQQTSFKQYRTTGTQVDPEPAGDFTKVSVLITVGVLCGVLCYFARRR